MHTNFDELWPDGPRFCAEPSGFRACTDSILLAAFVRSRADVKAFIDLGCGGGVLTLLTSKKLPGASAWGIEISPDAAELCRICLRENGVAAANIITGDLREYRGLCRAGAYDVVVSNPPYYPKNSGKISDDSARAAARTELCCTLRDICGAAAYMLRWGGIFYMVHKPERLAEIIYELKDNGIEPKRLRFIQNTPRSAPSLILFEGLRGGAPGLAVEPPLIMTDENGRESAEIKEIYHR